MSKTGSSYMNMEMLRFTTAGSVDDGKSTLIGRLLYDSKSIFADQLEAVVEKRVVAAKIHGRDDFLGAFGIVDAGLVGGVGDRGKILGVAFVDVVVVVVADPLEDNSPLVIDTNAVILL